MNQRTIYLAVALSFIALFPPRLASQDIKNITPERTTVARKVKGPVRRAGAPPAQRAYHTSAENWFATDINDTETRVSEAAAAEHFMQLKAQVIADLIRLEDGGNTEPIQDNVRTPKSDFHVGGSSKLSSTNQIKESRAQLLWDAPPAPSKTVAASNNK